MKSTGPAGDLRHLPEGVAEYLVSNPACYSFRTSYEQTTDGKLSFEHTDSCFNTASEVS